MAADIDQTHEALSDLATEIHDGPIGQDGPDMPPNVATPGPTAPDPPDTPPENGTGDPKQNAEKYAPDTAFDSEGKPVDPAKTIGLQSGDDGDPWRQDVLDAAGEVDKAEDKLAKAKEQHKAAKDAFDSAVTDLREAIAAVDAPRLPLKAGGPDEFEPGPEFDGRSIDDLDIPMLLRNSLTDKGIQTLGEIREQLKAGTIEEFYNIGTDGAEILAKAIGQLIAATKKEGATPTSAPVSSEAKIGDCGVTELDIPKRLCQALVDEQLLTIRDVHTRLQIGTLAEVKNVGPNGLKLVEQALKQFAEEWNPPPEARTVRVVGFDEDAFAAAQIGELNLTDRVVRLLDSHGFRTVGGVEIATKKDELVTYGDIGKTTADRIAEALELLRDKYTTTDPAVETNGQEEAP